MDKFEIKAKEVAMQAFGADSVIKFSEKDYGGDMNENKMRCYYALKGNDYIGYIGLKKKLLGGWFVKTQFVVRSELQKASDNYHKLANEYDDNAMPFRIIAIGCAITAFVILLSIAF